MNKFELENRLIKFAVLIIEVANHMHHSKAGNHLSGQLVRSGTAPALNYGEAQSGESRRDFIHKIKIALKELRESLVCLKIIREAELCTEKASLHKALQENDELIAIFVKSVTTAQRKLKK
ncbi:MAG TPA: four helix bundle protein [Balneolaceae bacterium]|nr:four helix bundle protein [Balneolaceae bacterium]